MPAEAVNLLLNGILKPFQNHKGADQRCQSHCNTHHSYLIDHRGEGSGLIFGDTSGYEIRKTQR